MFYGQVALRELPNDALRQRLVDIYNSIILFVVFSSVICHGVTIPVAKLGMNLIRRTPKVQSKDSTFARSDARRASENGQI